MSRATAFRLALLVLAAALAAPLLGPAPAAAAAGPCLPDYPHGAQCSVWKGTVRSVNDGDTFDASVPRDGLGGLLRVRITGVQAMEQTSYRAARRAGDCHAVDATKRLEQLIRRSRKRVRVAALYPESRSRGRRLRSVAVRVKGRWRDVGRILLREGHALWWPTQNEDAANVRYSVLAQQAAAARRGLFSPNHCGIGPSEGHPIKLWANWDADGSDTEDPNGEWVKVRNLDPVNPLPLGGWYLRDSALRRFTFPSHTVLPPGGTATVYAGQGAAFGDEYFWNLTRPVFDNTSRDDRGLGDGAYLFDPQGDVRAHMMWPCRLACTDPAQGALALDASPRRDEFVVVRNVASYGVDLENYQLRSHPYGYAFPQGAILHPGQAMRVYTQGDPADDGPLAKHWGMTSPILNNGGDTAKLMTFTDLTVACTAWGSRSC